MYALDFEYDGQYLSDFGFIICDFNGADGAQTATPGSKITFNTVSRYRGKRHSLIGTQYDECIQTKFHICKDPELFDDLSITNDEYRDLMRWLNRNEFLRFQVLYENKDDKKRDACFFDASFNIGKITIREILYGLELTMETNKPFGYGEEQVHTKTFTNAGQTYIVYDFSDEIGYIYPSITITCNSTGDLTVKNSFDNCNMLIKGCKTGEIITIDGDALIISTSSASHDICNNFNYEFLRIGNTLNNRANKITVSLPCKFELRYSPIIKDIP